MDFVFAGQREAQPNGCAVVEDVDGELGDVEDVKEGANAGGEVGEGVFVGLGCWNFGETETGQVGCDDAVLFAEEGDEVAILVRGGGEAVEKEEDRCVGGTGGAVEDVEAVSGDEG